MRSTRATPHHAAAFGKATGWKWRGWRRLHRLLYTTNNKITRQDGMGILSCSHHYYYVFYFAPNRLNRVRHSRSPGSMCDTRSLVPRPT